MDEQQTQNQQPTAQVTPVTAEKKSRWWLWLLVILILGLGALAYFYLL